ncbi:MAG: OsmC family protein [Candidatus Lokiarchaeota archaeon]|nr:OsmC family protein [Candidatus Lokiarchaeota archaeon]
MNVKDCFIDDTHESEVDMLGPNPSRLLGLALLGCLSASFIFCLKKKELTLKDLRADANIHIGRNKRGFLRVLKIDVNIKTIINDLDTRKRAEQCRKMFEQYCTVTQAVREGIDVNVIVEF